MARMRSSIILGLGLLLGIGVAVVGYGLHKHVDFTEKARHFEDHAVMMLDRVFNSKVRAARLQHVVPPAPYFPVGAIWTQDVSHAPLDRQSATMIAWLADAGGWGTGKMRVDLNIRVLQAEADTPYVPFHEGPGFYEGDSDVVAKFPLPVGGGIEGESGYQCPIDQEDCHLIVVDRSHGKLYETFQANQVSDARCGT